MPRFKQRIFKKRKGVGKPKIPASNSADTNNSGGCTQKPNSQGHSDNQPETDSALRSTSKLKLKNLDYLYGGLSEDGNKGNEILDISILSNIISECVSCIECGQSGMIICAARRDGLATELKLLCKHCNYSKSFFSSKIVPTVGNDDSNSRLFEINVRLVYGLRSIGRGKAAGDKLCGILNLPQAPARFEKCTKAIAAALKYVTCNSMKQAVEEAVLENNGNRDLSVAFDGSWQKRGHTSQNGIFTATSVDTGKVLDVEILSKHCRCRNKKQHDPNCSANYTGTSGGMEVAGAIAVCKRSVPSYGIRYVNYLGDGDSKAFKAVQDLNIYGNDVAISKLECVGHVQKRMGTRLRRLKVSLKGKKLGDGKPLQGKNRLTDAQIDQIQTYYGLAIRRNTNDISKMKEAVWALYFHKASTNDKPQHGLCPPGDTNWCKFRKSEVSGEKFDHPHSLPEAVMAVIKPVFRDLAQPELLKKCLHGRTQNPNECVNSIIWSRLPKTTFIGMNTLEFGVHDAVACFNDGQIVKCRVLEKMGIPVGCNTAKAMQAIDVERIRNSERVMSDFDKKARTDRRQAKRKLEEDFEPDPDNPAYGTGMY